MDTLEQLVGGEGKRVTLEEAQGLIKAGGFVYFGNRVCPFAHRAFWAAEELGFAKNWTYVHIDLGARKPAWYTQINPLGTVPCLFAGGKPVFESLILAEFVNDTQKASLLPADPLSKATVRFVIARFDDTVKGALYGTLSNKVCVCVRVCVFVVWHASRTRARFPAATRSCLCFP
jgi:glutathione S-transferase